MMNCRRSSNLLSAYIDGELNGVEMLAVREHLGECAACRQEYESLRATKQLLCRLQNVAARDDLPKTICSRLDEIETPAYLRLWADLTSGFRGKLSPAFATVAAVSVAFLLVGARGRTPHTYDVARVWQQLPKPIALSFSDLARNDLDISAATLPAFWKSNVPPRTPQGTVTLASLTQ